MKPIKIFGFAIMILVLLPSASAQTPNRPPDYDAVKDFSIQSNPNGVWSYGYLSTWGAPFTLYTWGGTCGELQGISMWRIYSCNNDTPGVYHNDTKKTICWLTWCLPPSYLLLDPRSQPTVVRWTAPSSGTYLMQVTFVGLDRGYPTSTNVYVLRNSKRLFLQAPVTSYQWPLLLHPYRWTVAAGDTVDFIVDWGQDKIFEGDATGAEVKVWSMGQR